MKENDVWIQIENKVYRKISIHLAMRTLRKSVTISKVFAQTVQESRVTLVYVWNLARNKIAKNDY